MSALRLVELRLSAFGAFSGEVLALGEPPGALHVVYGPNEAGKSTALRAIRALLFGVPGQTRDAYRHAMADLRIGGRLAAADGRVIDIVRRKGNKQTLLDPGGTPLPDSTLAPFLGGVSEELFMAMYGLTHESLRAGGEALLRGQGDVGEMLFDAARGGRSVSEVLERLRNEADALFRPRGRKARINLETEAFRQAKKRVRELSLQPQRFTDQKKEVELARRQTEELVRKRRELRTEQQRLLRIQRAEPLVSERLELDEERKRLARGVLVAPETRELRERAERELADARREEDHIAAELRRLELRRAELPKGVSLGELSEDLVEDLRARLGSHKKAHEDLPKRRGELRQLEERAMSLEASLGRSGRTDGNPPVDRVTRARLHDLTLKHSRIEQSLTEARRRLSDVRAELEVAEGELRAMEAPVEDSAIEALAERFERLKLPDELRELELERELTRERIEHQGSALGLIREQLERLLFLPVPTMEAVEHAEERIEGLGREEQRVQEQRQASGARRLEIAAELEFLQSGGEPPTEEGLLKTRTHRDTAFEELADAYRAAREPKEIDTLEAAYRRALESSDGFADRMRREADRVNRHALFAKELTQVDARLDDLTAQSLALADWRQELEDAWRRTWKTSGLEAGPPPVMRGWLRRFLDLRGEAEALKRLEVAARQRGAELGELREGLAAALARIGALPVDASDESALRAARHWVSQMNEARREHGELTRRVRQSSAERDALTLQAAEREAELRAWQRDWQAAVEAIGLPADTLPEAARAVLEGLHELGTITSEIEHMKRRVLGIERDAARFTEDVEALLRAHLPELLGKPIAQAASALVQRYGSARKADLEREHLKQEEVERLSSLRTEEDRARAAEGELKRLLQRSRAGSLEELKEAEACSLRINQVDDRLRELDALLREVRRGATIEELTIEVQAEDPTALRVRLDEIEDELREIDEEHQAAVHRVGGLEAGLQRLDTSSGAAEAAEEAEAALAMLRSHVARYARLRLSVRLVERELERYRDRHQGPIVSRASELLKRLTQGRYAGLRAEYTTNDQPVLACLDSNGSKVGVADLSDGTRDQLYLALRLSTLELQATQSGTLPLVLDDVFVHFDDARTEVALAVLGMLSVKLQIIVFTHHAKVVELARRTLPSGKLVVHELAGPAPS